MLIKVDGVWRDIAGIDPKKRGDYKSFYELYIKVNGSWLLASRGDVVLIEDSPSINTELGEGSVYLKVHQELIEDQNFVEYKIGTGEYTLKVYKKSLEDLAKISCSLGTGEYFLKVLKPEAILESSNLESKIFDGHIVYPLELSTGHHLYLSSSVKFSLSGSSGVGLDYLRRQTIFENSIFESRLGNADIWFSYYTETIPDLSTLSNNLGTGSVYFRKLFESQQDYSDITSKLGTSEYSKKIYVYNWHDVNNITSRLGSSFVYYRNLTEDFSDKQNLVSRMGTSEYRKMFIEIDNLSNTATSLSRLGNGQVTEAEPLSVNTNNVSGTCTSTSSSCEVCSSTSYSISGGISPYTVSLSTSAGDDGKGTNTICRAESATTDGNMISRSYTIHVEDAVGNTASDSATFTSTHYREADPTIYYDSNSPSCNINLDTNSTFATAPQIELWIEDGEPTYEVSITHESGTNLGSPSGPSLIFSNGIKETYTWDEHCGNCNSTVNSTYKISVVSQANGRSDSTTVSFSIFTHCTGGGVDPE